MKGFISLFVAGGLSLDIPACGAKPSEHSATDGPAREENDQHGGHHHGDEAAGARYVEGKGISLLDETKKAIGLELSEAGDRKLAPLVTLEAQVYRAATEPSRPGGEQTGSAYATAFVDPPVAEKLKGGESATLEAHETSYEARVWRIDPVSKEALNNVEVILEIPDPGNTLHLGKFVSGSLIESGAEQTVLTIPRSAVLETATGKFAFVENGDYLLRTAVTTGVENGDYAEITDGIYAGDIVASKPVETLYLIELRATKGGGHSH
jgi:multidrug efflux pump subunit AcrA (membrane-fusion protein)